MAFMMNSYGGGSSQMMSMSMSSVSLVACAAIAAGGFWYMTNKNKESGDDMSMTAAASAAASAAAAAAGPTSTGTAGTSGEPAGTVNDGLYNIKYGGVNMIVNPYNCTTTDVGFGEAVENDRAAWNLRQVPGRPGMYYVSSEHRLFKKGCDLKYLTAPVSCDGSPVLDTAKWADRQYWKLVPGGGDGKFQLRSVSCMEKRANSYLTSRGSSGGWNTSVMSPRDGSPYSLVPWSA